MQNKVSKNLSDRFFDINLHKAWIDEREGVATFPLYNGEFKMVGYQQYRPDGLKQAFNNPREGKYFTYRKGEDNTGVWGMESWYLTNTLFITEGVFDAARLTSRGVSAIAMLSNDLSRAHATWLKLVRKNRLVVAVCDNDSAGRKLAKFGSVAHVMEGEKDMGDASDEYVTQFLKEYL